MAKIPTTPKLEQMTAVHLLRHGKANPEQQKIAHQYITELWAAQKNPSDLPKRLTSERDRNVMIHRYMQLCEQDGEPISQLQACREFAELSNIAESTVKREFSRWKNQDEAEKQKDIDSWGLAQLEAVNGIFS